MWCGPLKAQVTPSCTTSAVNGFRSIMNNLHGNNTPTTNNHYQSPLWTPQVILLCFDWLEWNNNMPGNESPLCHFCWSLSERKLSQVTFNRARDKIKDKWHSHLCTSSVFDLAYSPTSGKYFFLFIYVKKTNHCV